MVQSQHKNAGTLISTQPHKNKPFFPMLKTNRHASADNLLKDFEMKIPAWFSEGCLKT